MVGLRRAVVKANEIESWAQQIKGTNITGMYEASDEINQRVALWAGNITQLKVDGIQNAAKNTLLGGGGIDGAIHSAAGRKLVKECRTLGGCATGDTKITKGYDLPSKYVLHTVGPVGEKPDKLRSCYQTTLDLALKHKLKTIALCGVSTGIYGYPREAACRVACETVREWLMKDDHWKEIEKIIFVTFLHQETVVYRETMAEFFPNTGEGPKKEQENTGSSNLILYYLTLSSKK